MKYQNFEVADAASPEPEVAGPSPEMTFWRGSFRQNRRHDGFCFYPLVVMFLSVTKKIFKDMKFWISEKKCKHNYD